MGFEDEVKQSFGRPCRRTDGQVQADIRTHFIHRPARDIIPPRGGARVSSSRPSLPDTARHIFLEGNECMAARILLRLRYQPSEALR